MLIASKNKILVVDDDPSVSGMLEDLLKEEGYNVISTQTGEEGLKILREGQIKIALVDIRLEKMDGLELMGWIRRKKFDCEVILMTSYASIETVLEAIRLGAHDYLIKPFERLELVLDVISRTMEKVRLKEENSKLAHDLLSKNRELKQVNEKIKNLAVRDGLTGLYNQRFFKESLEKEISRSERHIHKFCVLMMDLDHFKKYNDTYGHLMGDSILKVLGRVFLDGSRSSDIIARYGGEEFAAILPETDKKRGIKIAKGFRKQIEKMRPAKNSPEAFKRITISIGLAEYPGDAEDPMELIKKADTALYGAKFNGRNQVLASGDKPNE